MCVSLVHGRDPSNLPEHLYPLNPFPNSPKVVEALDLDSPVKESNLWLAAVMSPANDIRRRLLIRDTWMKLYRDVPFTPRFVVSNPGPRWVDVVSSENRTYGDLIVLEHLQEDDLTANTIKTLESFKWLVERGQRYEFVSKIDTDVMLNAHGLWHKYLEPRISNTTRLLLEHEERTVIGELYYWPPSPHHMVFVHGPLYTCTWDMVELLASLQGRFDIRAAEDLAITILLKLGGEKANMVNLNGKEIFDFDEWDTRSDGTAWAWAGSHPGATDHAISSTDGIAIHKLKRDSTYKRVFDCLDSSGIKQPPPHSSNEWGPTLFQRLTNLFSFLGFYRSRLDNIPDFFWKLEDGSWVCDGVWKVGKTKYAAG